MISSKVLAGLLAASAIFCAPLAQADTVRFTYNTNADQTRTSIFSADIVSGPTNSAAGQYNGRVANVTGFLDLDLSGATPVIVDYSFVTLLPHGLPSGYADLFPSAGYSAPGPFATATLSKPTATVETFNPFLINITQEFLFDTRYGPGFAGFGGGHVGYDPNDATLYPFLMRLTLLNPSGTGLKDGSAYNVNRLQMDCNVFNGASLNPAGCNGYPSGNYGFWNSNGVSGAPTTITAAPSGPQDPLSTVPLPAGLPLLLTAFGGLALAHRRRT